jgi:hypothetical protein
MRLLVARAEEALGKCRTAKDLTAFDSSAQTLRDEVQVVSDNNRRVRVVIDQLDIDARTLAFPGRNEGKPRSSR